MPESGQAGVASSNPPADDDTPATNGYAEGNGHPLYKDDHDRNSDEVGLETIRPPTPPNEEEVRHDARGALIASSAYMPCRSEATSPG